MTTASKTRQQFLNAVVGAAGSSKTAPGATSGWVSTGTADGGDMGLSITNSGGALGAAPTILIQWSPDNGTTIYDYWAMGGDTTASSVNTSTVWIDPGLQYVRVIGYGNTTNSATFGADFSGVTRA